MTFGVMSRLTSWIYSQLLLLTGRIRPELWLTLELCKQSCVGGSLATNSLNLPVGSQPHSCGISALYNSSGQATESYIYYPAGLNIAIVYTCGVRRLETWDNHQIPRYTVYSANFTELIQLIISDRLLDLDLPNYHSRRLQELLHSWNTCHALASALEITIYGSHLRCCCPKDL